MKLIFSNLLANSFTSLMSYPMMECEVLLYSTDQPN